MNLRLSDLNPLVTAAITERVSTVPESSRSISKQVRKYVEFGMRLEDLGLTVGHVVVVHAVV